MSVNPLMKPFLAHPLFNGLTEAQLSEIIRNSKRLVFSPGQTIICEDSPSDAAVLIISGDALRMCGPNTHDNPEHVPPGSLIGEMTMLIDTQHTSTIVARSAVCALQISRSNLHDQMASDPKVADHFVAKISSRLEGMASALRAMDQTLSAVGDSPQVQ